MEVVAHFLADPGPTCGGSPCDSQPTACRHSCERNWSAYEWIHDKKRNRLGVTHAEKLVRSFSNLNLLSRHAMYESGLVEWDLEMLLDENEEDEPARQPPRSSERIAERARRAEGGLAHHSLAPAARVRSLEVLNQPAPPAASARGRGRSCGGSGTVAASPAVVSTAQLCLPKS